ncbi:tyrosine-protein kinase Etk/Wzc [Pantoea alhagi]|uniref:tyrosine-protein kinase Wzc n=1 Tax=Mixta sp. BE291 TaxID=3158787 RepID=UPI0028578EA3|nr:tyrosine-protein kinase Etk/Wzc [Pantoea alhagi]
MVNKKSDSSQKIADAKDEIDVARLYGSIIDHRWLIIGVTALFAVIGIIYSILATPIYRADALVQVEQNQGSLVMSQISNLMPDTKPTSDAQIGLIMSRMVLGKTIEDLNLQTTVAPKYVPVVGAGWARLMGNDDKKAAVSRLELPPELIGSKLVLDIGENNTFTLSGDDGELVKGKVGQSAEQGKVKILVSDTNAEPGDAFVVQKNGYLPTYNDLVGRLSVVDQGKDTGVLALTLNGPDPQLTQETLRAITENYLLQNVERKSEEAQKSLDFIQRQLPEVRQKLDDAENKLNAFRQQNDSVDLTLEAKSMLDTMVNVDNQLNELTFREAEISKLYTKEHPAYRTLLEKRKTLRDEKKSLEGKVSSLPRTQQEIIRLTRDVDAGQAVFMQLLNKQQELSINKASTVGNVRIVDPALVLNKPIAPRSAIIIAISLVLGLLVSTIYVLMKTILIRGIESPEQLENSGINVYASIPISEWQQQRDRKLALIGKEKGKKAVRGGELLALANPADLAIEAVRSLRTTMHFAMLDAPNNIVMISGSSPDIGKTFISTNLAAVVAQSGQRVLFIDGDMRKGYSHELFNSDNRHGMSDLLSNQATLEQAIRPTNVSGLDFIPRGQLPPNPSELLMSQKFVDLMASVQKLYDIVIIDTPPILAVTDAAIIGMQAGTNMVVAGFEKSTVKEIEVSVRRFEQNGIEIKGAILNLVVKKAASAYGYGYYHYSYESTKP